MELNSKRIAVEKIRAESELERQDLEAKVKKAEEKNDAISTTRGFETYVRTTYPVVKSGEGVIVIYEDGESPVSPVRADMTLTERIKVFLQGLFAKD